MSSLRLVSKSQEFPHSVELRFQDGLSLYMPTKDVGFLLGSLLMLYNNDLLPDIDDLHRRSIKYYCKEIAEREE